MSRSALFSCGGGKHILDEDAVTGCGIIHQHVGDGADELAVLDNGAAGHVCVKDRTTFLSKQLTVLVKMVIIDEKE